MITHISKITRPLMPLAIFDLDNTLLGGDSDQLWGMFIAENGGVDADHHRRESQRYYEDYLQGQLDVEEFLAFTLNPLSRHNMDQLLRWREAFIEQHIKPILLPKALELVEKHRQQGDTLMIITATNYFITRPVADLFGIETLLATMPEIIDNRFTGQYTGTATFQHGKVIALEQWVAENNASLVESTFYSDSHNDIPLLEQVTYPVAVDPDDRLRERALENGWPVISLRA